ncbi:MAG TPA: flagellar export chaperone FliS [Bryobacteraceae bacterium]|nr:flagellar export chaperone FliS [Bryobacteraceae bacterium]
MPETYLENRILSADPVELIQILYEHAIQFVQQARAALAAGDIVGRSRAISRTIGIVGELEGSLDREAGGSLSQNLAALYGYMRKRLTMANLKQEDGPLAEVESLLETLFSAWKAIDRKVVETPVMEAASLPQNGDGRFAETTSVYTDHSWTA